MARADWQGVTPASQPTISREPIKCILPGSPKQLCTELVFIFQTLSNSTKKAHCSMVPEHGISKAENTLLFLYYSNTGKEKELKMLYQNLG